MRWVIGNLDCEAEMARMAGARPATTSEAGLRTASALATLLRVFAGEGDTLWTPRPVDEGRIPEVPGLPKPEFRSGSIDEGEISFVWAETTPVAARVNHRGFLLEHAAEFPDRLPGIRKVESVADAENGATPFLLKAPWSAAGRHRILGRGPLDAADRTRAEGLLERYGVLIREPWLDRTLDFGCSGRVDEDGVDLHAPHRLLTDSRGAFTGIAGPFDSPLAESVEIVARRAGELLRANGYRGRFGVDGLTGRDPEGRDRVHLPCEINARTTFGHVAAAIAAALGGGDGGFELRIGRGLPPEGVPLLLPAPGDPTEVRFIR